MTFNVRPYSTDIDYEDLKKWWVAHNWEPIPKEFLPLNGLVVEEKDTGKCCLGFVMQTDTAYCFIEFITANPLIPTESRSLAVDLLIDELKAKAKELGFVLGISTISNASLLRRFEKKGFRIVDKNVTHVLGGL